MDYFTIESLENNNSITATKSGSNKSPVIYYSTDGGETWSNQTLSSGTKSLGTINAGETIIFKCEIDSWSSAWNGYNKLSGSKNFKVYGNAMSLLNGDNFANNSEFASGSTYNLCGLFYGTTTLTDANNLILPAVTGNEGCYNGMFRGCTNLQYGPKELPATAINDSSYSSMFEGCINLEEAPVIWATTMSGAQAMQRMFCMDRSSKITTPKLTKGPILRASTQTTTCYKEMFKGNGNLVEVTNLSINRPGGSTENWLSNCSDTGTFYQHPDSPSWGRNASGVPSGWTIQNATV